MRIEVKGRNFVVDDDVRARVEKRFEKVAKQVAQMAVLELELTEERNPAIHDACIAEGTLHVKGVTLRAREASDNMAHSIHLVADDLARQVKRHRDKRRGRRGAVKPAASELAVPPEGAEAGVTPGGQDPVASP